MVLVLLFPFFTWAQTPNTTLTYKFFKNYILNLDKFIEEEINLKPISCIYESFATKEKWANPGLDACLFQNFEDGFKTQNIPGKITAQVQNLKTNRVTLLEIKWRPARQTKLHFLQRLSEDYFKVAPKNDTEGLLGSVTVAGDFRDFSAISGAEKIAIESLVDKNNPLKTNFIIQLFAKDLQRPYYKIVVNWDFLLFHHEDIHIEGEGE